jgi:hypothetical protein
MWKRAGNHPDSQVLQTVASPVDSDGAVVPSTVDTAGGNSFNAM